jgi:hypothetical protein
MANINMQVLDTPEIRNKIINSGDRDYHSIPEAGVDILVECHKFLGADGEKRLICFKSNPAHIYTESYEQRRQREAAVAVAQKFGLDQSAVQEVLEATHPTRGNSEPNHMTGHELISIINLMREIYNVVDWWQNSDPGVSVVVQPLEK